VKKEFRFDSFFKIMRQIGSTPKTNTKRPIHSALVGLGLTGLDLLFCYPIVFNVGLQ
jgi:hypothetical protein